MNRHTDQHYIQKTLNGDTNAFSVLIDRYQNLVYTVVLRVVKVKEEAEEVAQDTFLKAFESLSGYRGESKFSTWIYSIAYRKALDRVRKNSRMKPVELVEDITEKNVEDIDNALHFLELQERNHTIRKCIEQLPEKEAAIITFYYFDDLSVREISAITELTEDNIKVKLHRSRKKLFSLLKQFVLPEISNSNGRAI
ncbi:MAG: RNA polymerase sigma factor [Bacteroidia bacterium]|nr:RNA polymerase sigma factor [Bacteroidia bacterium]NNF30284.1 RNA polymerase sigma factor [Flavobacteriaceae bacterium]NNK55008.1 RNA polymerase sigma factor [Flavobacteriaceae bacterium]NNM08645.1 RNA polymerase sigma factor [Flavobacteriaceae bacterium]